MDSLDRLQNAITMVEEARAVPLSASCVVHRGELLGILDEVRGFRVERLRLLEVDDVDLVAMAEDVRGHLGVPEAGLVAKVHTGFQHFTHADRHRDSKGWF